LFLTFRYIDRFTLDAFALSGFDYHVNSLKDPTAVLYRFMLSFNKAAAADNPLVGLAREYTHVLSRAFLYWKIAGCECSGK